MRVLESSYNVLLTADEGLSIAKAIERAGRVCYKSEEKITDISYIEFLKSIIKMGHESVLEHKSISVEIVCDRGVSHELVRHRLASFSQESTRYCNYTNRGIEFINPSDFVLDEQDEYILTMLEDHYNRCILKGMKPQQARYFLPNGLKTEMTLTANLREWRLIFKLRTAKAAHPDMRKLMIPMLKTFQHLIPVIFDDL